MTAVTVVIRTGRLAQEMSRMRLWLDERGCQPAGFATEQRDDNSLLCHVTFAQPDDDAAFAARFGHARRPLKEGSANR